MSNEKPIKRQITFSIRMNGVGSFSFPSPTEPPRIMRLDNRGYSERQSRPEHSDVYIALTAARAPVQAAT